MVGVKPVGSDPDFQPELSGAGSRLAVVKFTMRGTILGVILPSISYFSHRCGPCLRIAPAFSSMSNKYPQAVFLEVDVHQCQGTAATNNISATPTFLFFRNKVRIDQYQGADAVGLEEKIKQHLENDPGSNEDTDIPKGYMDLMPFINKAGCECLNESDEHGFDNCLRKDMTFLESDCDEQLLITVAFNQPVKLYSMKFQGPDNGQGPKYVKIFINLPRSMDFEEAERSEPTQALELTEDDIKEDGIVPLRYVKFQNVNSVTEYRCVGTSRGLPKIWKLRQNNCYNFKNEKVAVKDKCYKLIEMVLERMDLVMAFATASTQRQRDSREVVLEKHLSKDLEERFLKRLYFNIIHIGIEQMRETCSFLPMLKISTAPQELSLNIFMGGSKWLPFLPFAE
ncbi:hypothetical protein EI555_007504 [Monodon monoceros]|uniref:PITH domain-containing protein n=1 Tax=Monodon monoceros TaxID=40151 RepID=A0A4U1EHH5_MONMO|nr:hypothetical protein EI555_007504 [Monodon monoceros]